MQREFSEAILKTTFNRYDRRKNKDKKYNKNTHYRKLIENRPASNPMVQETEINQNSQIISGYFLNEKPYKELIIQRVNNFLYAVLGFLVLFCFVCYYLVSCKEVQLNQISRETLELNYENDELQNKVDSLQSYYNIDKAVQKTNILERAKEVVEVDAVDLADIKFPKKSSKKRQSFVVSY